MILVPTYSSWNIYYSLAWIELSFRSVGRNKKLLNSFTGFFFFRKKTKITHFTGQKIIQNHI